MQDILEKVSDQQNKKDQQKTTTNNEKTTKQVILRPPSKADNPKLRKTKTSNKKEAEKSKNLKINDMLKRKTIDIEKMTPIKDTNAKQDRTTQNVHLIITQ